ncbi:hypothetical protein BD408DRAFT_340203 [Parasitella parasitica]|nr:hypothetical protein BD408DRAFT_340203 [Parasitella parasitica]
MTKDDNHVNSTDIHCQYSEFDHADAESDEKQQKRTSWCLENNDDEQRLREELIQRATARLRRRMLEQGLQDVMHQVVSLQTQLETLRVDAAATIDIVSTIFDESKTAEGTQKMNRQMDVLERRLEAHRTDLSQLQETQQEHQPVGEPTRLTSEAMKKTDSNLTAMSRLTSHSLMSSIFGRGSAATSRATSVTSGVSEKSTKKHQQQQQQDPFESLSTLEDDDNISHIESIGNSDWNSTSANEEDHPFYDLAGKRSFGAGSFCGSVYHGNQQDPITIPAPCTNTAEIRSRRRQRRQRHKQQLEQLQHPSEDDIYMRHPLSPSTPPPNCTGSFFDQIQQQSNFNDKKDSMLEWLSNHGIYPQRNILDDTMSFLDDIGENGSDGGFRQDLYLLLKNPDLCCRPFSEIESKMSELRRQDTNQLTVAMLKDVLTLFKPTFWCQLAMKYSTNLIYNLTCSGLEWSRFLSVLAAAVVISIMKGPEDIRRSVY